MSVGLVIVSHSQKLAEGVAELAGQMANDSTVVIAPAGGSADGTLGTSVDKVLYALEQADCGEGALVLLDLGSAGMVVEMALEALPADRRQRVQISTAPLVEGAVLAAVEASIGRSLSEVAAAAAQAHTLSKLSSER